MSLKALKSKQKINRDMVKLDEKRLSEILRELGLSKREADIYVYLSRKGPQKAHSVAVHLDIDRAQMYRSLTSLQEKGIVELTIEAPKRYIAVPIESLLKSYIDDKKSEVTRIETEKDDIINYFKSISAREPEYPMAKFQVITGRSGIHTKISEMVNQAQKEVLSLTTSIGLIQEDLAGILDAIIESVREKKDVQFRMLANVTNENLKIMKATVKRITVKKTNAEWRHIDLGSKFYPRFVIKDDEEVILYMISKGELSTPVQEDTGLWVTSRMFVSTLKSSFEEIWRNAIDVNERINELETGTPREETLIIKEPADAKAKIEEILGATKNEVIVISSSASINEVSDKDPYQEFAKKGVKIRIMAPIDLDNLEAAQSLSKLYEIKHVSISYLTMMIADSKHLFIFKAPGLEESTESPFYLRNAFYTNDRKFVERATELLRDIWKRGTLVSEIETGGPLGTPIIEVPSSQTILTVVDTMLRNGVSSVLVSEKSIVVGIIDQRDILEKILKKGKDPKKIVAAEVMSTPVLTVDSETPLMEALRTIKKKRIPRLAVMRKGKLIAMLT
jgi:sugar-specific transcriptional regulator TrmB/CBS domain-containing protein